MTIFLIGSGLILAVILLWLRRRRRPIPPLPPPPPSGDEVTLDIQVGEIREQRIE